MHERYDRVRVCEEEIVPLMADPFPLANFRFANVQWVMVVFVSSEI